MRDKHPGLAQSKGELRRIVHADKACVRASCNVNAAGAQTAGHGMVHILIEMDFEDYPGSWFFNNNATGGNSFEEPQQGRRSARLTGEFPPPSQGA